jgi:XTP/dITP diphosphohydrolase|tara:strand:- start:8736 stop:9347 length:612 start_codon:yes stop_codon:yes gene_type:complete
VYATVVNRLLFLTGNIGKLVEARHFFEPLGYQVEQFLIDGEVPIVIEPQSDSLKDVATAKIEQAKAYLNQSGQNASILVEDAGLFIDELNGFPGVNSASVLNQIGLSGVLNLMSEITHRGAEFRACVALFTGGELVFGVGVCRGTITSKTLGDSGFGYDPIFSPDGEASGRTFGQMSSPEKEDFSHRAKALQSVKKQLDLLGR